MISNGNPSVPESTWCGGAITASKSDVTISASVFYGNSATVGGAIFSSSSNITIVNCTLVRNTADSASGTPCHGGVIHCESDGYYLEGKFTILNSKFVQNVACNGGTTSALFGRVDITNSLFQENSAITGGVALAIGADLIIHDSTFAYNFVLQTGGSIVVGNGSISIDTSEFISNQGKFCGALYLYECNAVILNSNFTNNTALEYGGVLGVNSSSVSMQMNLFHHNGAKQAAGVIYATEQCIVKVLDSQFINNRVYGTGAAFWFYLSSVKVEASIFSHNMALTNCSSLSSSMSKVVIFNSQFVHNTAWENGGVLCSKMETDMTINNCQFTDNKAKQGGVLFMETGSESAIFNTIFTKSLAQAGGVFAAYDSNVTIMDSDFSENQAQFGGVFILLSLSTLIAVNDTFSENTATLGGGVFFTNGFCNLYMKEIVFTMNNAEQGGVWSAVRTKLTVINSKFSENSANDTGTGLSVFSSHVIIKGSHFINNTAFVAGVLSGAYNSSVAITNSEFVNNTAQICGVISLDSQARSDIARSHFNYNYADNGSILCLQIQSSVIINNSVLSNNMAFSKGAIIGHENTSVIIIESKLVNNRVERGPGGVASLTNGSKIVVEGSQLFNNRGSPGGVVYISMNSSATINACKMNNNTSFLGGVLAAMDNTTATITDCVMSGNLASVGGVIGGVRNFTANLTMCEFVNNTAYQGGAIYLSQGKMYIKKSKFFDNQANRGGVVNIDTESSLIIEECVLATNAAVVEDIAIVEQSSNSLYEQIKMLNLDKQFGFIIGHGGVIQSTGEKSSVTIVGCVFVNNTAYHDGGAISTSGTTLDIRKSEFYGNSAVTGSVFVINDSPSADVHNCSFTGNTAFLLGGAILASGGILNISHSQFSYNSASFGVIYIAGIKAVLGGTIDFSYNNGSVYAYSSELKLNGNIDFYQCLALNLEENEGGAITAFQSMLQLNGSLTFTNNSAKSGGAVHLTESTINIGNGDVTIVNNTAKSTGGGIYLYRSQLFCKENCTLDIIGNEASEKGGGIHAIGSTISVHADYKETFLQFVENSANNGGGICFEVDSKLYIMKNVSKYPTEDLFKVSFIRNTAMYGGAIHVADSTYFKICESTSQYGKPRSSIIHSKSSNAECFFQVLVLTLGVVPNLTSVNIGFTENYASIAGADLYGGLLDRCTANAFTFLYYKVNRTDNVENNLTISGVSYFGTISNTQRDNDSISSDPVRVCFCQNGKPDCGYHVTTKEVKKGETFSQSLVAVDQVNHTLTDIIIHSSLMFKESGIGEGQLSQKTGK
jgi:predicted outer membrane repeat protein